MITSTLDDAQDTSSSTPNGSNRRRSERRPYIIEAWIVPPAEGGSTERLEVTSVNMSRHGVAFDSTKPLIPGTFHLIEVGMGNQQLVSEIRIITCRAAENRVYEVGGEFC